MDKFEEIVLRSELDEKMLMIKVGRRKRLSKRSSHAMKPRNS